LKQESDLKPKNQITPEYMMALSQWSISVSLDEIMVVLEDRYQKLRDKLGDEKIDDFKTIMKFQMNIGLVVSDVV